MATKYRNLFELIIEKENLIDAARKARKGNPNNIDGMMFFEHLDANIGLLMSIMKDGSYLPSAPREFVVFEPKRRQISALPFKDRVVQHAINNIIEPIFDRTFYTQSYGCRQGKGTHSGAIKCQSLMRSLSKSNNELWILKTDFSGYFYNIDRGVLHERIRSKISCNKTLLLIEKFVPKDGIGIPIGNLTSQLFANIYGTIIDEWLLHKKKIKHFIRYMDDIVIFGSSKNELLSLKIDIDKFCESNMRLTLSHWSVSHKERGVNFLGYRIWSTHKLLRRQSVVSAKRKIRKYRESGDTVKLNMFKASWIGHANWANSYNLLKRLNL